MLSGVGVFGMELVLNAINIDYSPLGITIYMLAISTFGFFACLIAFFFPYRGSSDNTPENRERILKGFA